MSSSKYAYLKSTLQQIRHWVVSIRKIQYWAVFANKITPDATKADGVTEWREHPFQRDSAVTRLSRGQDHGGEAAWQVGRGAEPGGAVVAVPGPVPPLLAPMQQDFSCGRPPTESRGTFGSVPSRLSPSSSRCFFWETKMNRKIENEIFWNTRSVRRMNNKWKYTFWT